MVLWKLNDKQRNALKKIEEYKFTLLLGQGRSSKTTLAIYYLFKRALKYPNTSHVIFRNTLQSAKDGIWSQTIKEVIKHFYPILPAIKSFKLNESSLTITFPNGSRILVRGLDTEERATKILSQEFASIILDEGQTIFYTYLALLLTRIPQPINVDYKIKIIICANYAPKTHWMKLFFIDGLNPETKAPHDLETNFIKFETKDNTSINSLDYIKTLRAAGDRRAKNMCAGTDFYEEIEGALWEQSDIKRIDALNLDDYDDIIIAFDPAVTNKKSSDEHGVAIIAKLNDELHILECFEKKEDINVIVKEIIKLYKKYNCSKLVCEVNNGGDFIPALINNHSPDVYCESVRATRGKILRAEPVAALYKNGKVLHTKHFSKLESQMVTYTGIGNSDSPNALDALVWGVTYLHENVRYISSASVW